jgi:purine-binding chemotaxis protein CheW
LDVISLEAEQMRHTPEFGSVIDTVYIMRLGAVDKRMLISIGIQKMMGSSDMELIDQSNN